MTVSAAPTIFDVFNARQLHPRDVAATFVPPKHFESLVRPTHTLIVGPRGSGKTTLLKMLHPAALGAWEHRAANGCRACVNFTGVFVPADLNWSSQLQLLGGGRLAPEVHELFAKSAFTTQVLRALVESILCRTRAARPTNAPPHRAATLTAKAEAQFVTDVSSAWKLSVPLLSLEALDSALSRRLSDLQILASQEASRKSETGDRISDLEFLHLDFLQAAGVAITHFDHAIGEPDARWALLFDELELAPRWIRTMLLAFLRSVDQRFIFKLSISPYSDDLGAEWAGLHQPQEKQDYETVRLWYVNKEHGYPFCQELLAQLLQQRQLPPETAAEVFGHSVFEAGTREHRLGRSAYRSGGPLYRRFRSLAAKDASFRNYLQRRSVSLSQLEALESQKRPATVRKVTSLVALRDYFRGEGSSLFRQRGQRRRSRKLPTIYSGIPSLFAMVEGNPRWLIGILGSLLPAGHPRSEVSSAKQVRAVLDAANIFRAMLRTIPTPPVGNSSRGLLSVLDPVGDFFANAAIDEPFDDDPPCSFTVDNHVPEPMLEALGRALNAGAIVYAPGAADEQILHNLRGKRFRLSYLLAPHYYIPLVLGRSRSLSAILRRAEPDSFDEPTLFPH